MLGSLLPEVNPDKVHLFVARLSCGRHDSTTFIEKAIFHIEKGVNFRRARLTRRSWCVRRTLRKEIILLSPDCTYPSMFRRIERPFMEKAFVPEQRNAPPEVPDKGFAGHRPGKAEGTYVDIPVALKQ